MTPPKKTGRKMVAGALKNPWGFPGSPLRFGDDLWSAEVPAAEWTEHEIVPGGSPVIHRLFAGKERADTPDPDDGDFLSVEEPFPAKDGANPDASGKMQAMAPDLSEVKTDGTPNYP